MVLVFLTPTSYGLQCSPAHMGIGYIIPELAQKATKDQTAWGRS